MVNKCSRVSVPGKLGQKCQGRLVPGFFFQATSQLPIMTQKLIISYECSAQLRLVSGLLFQLKLTCFFLSHFCLRAFFFSFLLYIFSFSCLTGSCLSSGPGPGPSISPLFSPLLFSHPSSLEPRFLLLLIHFCLPAPPILSLPSY